MTGKGKIYSCLVLTASILLLPGCGGETKRQQDNTLFELLSPESTGIDFNNEIITSPSLSIMSYEYLYNGGGVGVGDFNNDGLQDIFFTGNMVPCKLYINHGNFSFEDVTDESGIDTKGIWAYGVSVVDINQDGLQDIYVCTGGRGNKNTFPNKLYVNKGDLTFKESAVEYGLADPGESIQATFFDYDRDGDIDMFLMQGGGFEKSAITPFPILKNGTGRNTDKLYRNDFDKASGHARFTDVSVAAGILTEGFGLGVSILDVNNDAWPDVYVTNDYLSKDHLYVNNHNGAFTDQIDQYLKHISYFAMGNDVGDINNDCRMDIVALDMLPEDNFRRKIMFGPNQYDKFYYGVSQGYGYQYMRNTLQLANENGGFSEIGQFSGIAKTNWSWAPLLADFDNDGFQDLVISNGFGKDITNLDYVKFRQPVAELSTEERLKVLLDRPEINIPNYAYKNNHNNTFTKVSKEWGFDIPSMSNGMAYADFDLDGDLDLVVNNINQEAFIFKNTLKEKKTANTNYIRVKLKGTKQNNDGLGATVTMISDSLSQVRYLNPVRGFESAVENVLHFGLGDKRKIDTIKVTWSDDRVSLVINPEINKTITISYEGSQALEKKKVVEVAGLLQSVSEIKFKHEENEFNDFLHQPLLQHKLSQEGPGISVADINNDGLEDIFIGGAYRLPAHFMIQNAKGDFVVKEFNDDFESEDMGSLFFDADADGDQDLFVVSGGIEFYAGHKNYQCRLYVNDGRGNFKKSSEGLPPLQASGSCVVAGDYDHDGDLDVFVGGRVTPFQYPKSPRSSLLKNEHGKFVDVTMQIAPELAEAGMITSALWTDFDNDNALDLMVVGEAMPIRFFKNVQGVFKDVTSTSGLSDSDGFWNSLVSGDFDNDGDMDYVAGNLGLNGPMRASVKEPITISYADFDNNGSVEPIIGYFEEGVDHPGYPLDILTSQLPSLKKKILYHKDYAAMSVSDVINVTGNKNYKTLYCKTLQSSFIRNIGNGKFDLIPLPQQAQLAPVYGMLAEDIDGDGNLDLLGVGNSYAQEIIYGRMDALIGLTLLGDGKGGFNFLSEKKSGFFVDGDAKGLARLETVRGSRILATQNNDSLKSFAIKKYLIKSRVKVLANETYAIVTLHGSRKRKLELNQGATYLSQSSHTILVTKEVESVQLFKQDGKLSRTLSFAK